MATMLERVVRRPENNPLPQRRQEELQHGEVPAGRQDPPPQRRQEKPQPKRNQVGGKNH